MSYTRIFIFISILFIFVRGNAMEQSDDQPTLEEQLQDSNGAILLLRSSSTSETWVPLTVSLMQRGLDMDRIYRLPGSTSIKKAPLLYWVMAKIKNDPNSEWLYLVKKCLQYDALKEVFLPKAKSFCKICAVVKTFTSTVRVSEERRIFERQAIELLERYEDGPEKKREEQCSQEKSY